MNREEAALKQTVKFTRKDAREFLMQTVFQMDAQKELDVSHLEKYLADRKFGTQTAYVNTVLHKMLENIEEIDSMINAVSDGWSTSRMAKPDLAISRVAAAEILSDFLILFEKKCCIFCRDMLQYISAQDYCANFND